VADVASLDALLDSTTVDCVVSSYQVLRRDGLEFLGGLYALQTVAEHDEDIPRILYTDIVNQDIAREAVSLGLFDYIPTNTEASRRRLVARVTDATAKRRAERRVVELSRVNDVIREVLTVLVRARSHEQIYEEVTNTLVATEAYDGALFGRRTAADIERLAAAGSVSEAVLAAARDGDESVAATTTVEHGSDQRSIVVPVTDDGLVLVLVTDRPEAFAETEREVVEELGETVQYSLEAVTTRETLERREASLQEKTERLSTFASVVGHDLRNPLAVASGNLELAETDGSARLDAVETALERMSDMIDDVLALARGGQRSVTVEPVPLAGATDAAWATVETGAATLSGPAGEVIYADPSQLQRLLENLFRNAVEHGSTGNRSEADDAVEHGGPGVEVLVEVTDDGFAVADDGPGLSQSDGEDVFELGVTGSASGTGLGLAIVENIADAHGWSVTVGESEAGGARFEFSGVEFNA